MLPFSGSEGSGVPWTALILLGGCATVTVALGYRFGWVDTGKLKRNCFNSIVRRTRKVHSSTFRKLAFDFRILPEEGYTVSPSHTHPEAALLRNSTVCSIRNALKAAKLETYDPSPSRAYRDKQVTCGHRHAYTVKDLAAPLIDEGYGSIPADTVITLVDQDYYFSDLNQFGGHPIVASTLSVDELSGTCPDSTWYFTGPNAVVEQVEGGATYVQSLFNYGTDQVVIPHSRWCFDIFTVYDVHIHKVPEISKMVVFLCPSSTHYLPLRIFQLCSRCLMGRTMELPLLTKMNHVTEHGRFLVMKCKKLDTVGYSIKRNCDQAHDSAVFVPEGTFKALEFMSRNPRGTSVAEVERASRAFGTPITGISLATVMEFFGTSYTDSIALNVFMPPSTSHGDLFYDIGKPKGELIIPPITDETAFVVSVNEAAQRSYVEERMLPNVNEEVFSSEMISYAKEYVELLIRQPGKCVPYTVAEVIADQSGPLQKARNTMEKKHQSLPKNKVDVALKAEAVLKGGPSRGVSTVTTSHSLDSGAISRGLKPALKRSKHYTVGLSPNEVAEKIRDLATRCRKEGVSVGETDYSKLDECISEDIREHLVNPTFLRAFARVHHEYVSQMLKNDHNCKGRVGNIKIDTKGKNNSGTGITTDINTIVCPFPVYVTHRRMGASREEAFSRLGVAFGDDGLSMGGMDGEAFATCCVQAAGEIGLKLKYLVHEPTCSLYFLGRLYLDPLTTSVSMSLPSKVLRKLPVCIGNADKHRADRLKGYYVTEQHVPVVGDYIRAAARAYKIDLEKRPSTDEMAAIRKSDRDLFYKISHGPYPYEVGDIGVLMTSVAADLDLGEGEVYELMAKLGAVNSVADFSKIRVPLPELEGMARFQWHN